MSLFFHLTEEFYYFLCLSAHVCHKIGVICLRVIKRQKVKYGLQRLLTYLATDPIFLIWRVK